MLNIAGLKKSYGSQELFEDVTFVVGTGERVGLVGRNGHGKSTLFRIILGQEQADAGEIHTPKDYSIGHLSQHLEFTEPSILDEVCLVLPLLDDCWKETYKAEAMLHGLGFSTSDFERAPSEFSGGYQIRLNIAKLLLSEPDLLLLDEPTNYLDIVSVRWLATFLQEWERELLIITHDRLFMDAVSTHTMGIHRGRVKKIEGGTEKFYTTLAEEEEIYEKTRKGEERKRAEIEKYVTRFRAKASKAKSVQSRVKQLEKMEVKESLSDIDTLNFSFNYKDIPSKWLLRVEDLSFGYEENHPLFSNLNFSVAKGDRVGVIGPNGKGKTTLLNVLAGELSASNGSAQLAANTEIAYFGQTNINRLHMSHTVETEIGEVNTALSRTAVRSICGAMMFEGDNALKEISVLSGGERSRVLLGKLLVQGSNLLFLDEPTNHLDMYSIDSLLEAMEVYPGGVVFVTHSELLLKQLANRLVVFDKGVPEVLECGYEEFLEERGWSHEHEGERGKSESVEKTEKQPSLNKQIDRLEKSIIKKEEEQKLLEQELLLLSENQNSSDTISKMSDISSEIEKIKKDIEGLFSEIESLS